MALATCSASVCSFDRDADPVDPVDPWRIRGGAWGGRADRGGVIRGTVTDGGVITIGPDGAGTSFGRAITGGGTSSAGTCGTGTDGGSACGPGPIASAGWSDTAWSPEVSTTVTAA